MRGASAPRFLFPLCVAEAVAVGRRRTKVCRGMLSKGRVPMATTQEETTMTAPLTIRLHPTDNVVVARMDILPGTKVEGEVAAATRVPPGHKILTRAVKKGEPLRKYNQIIGFATEDLAPARTSTRTTASWATSSATMPSAPMPIRPTTSCRPRPSGLSPRRRPRRHAQLHRHRHDGELLGRDQPHDRRAARAAAGAVSRTSTASCR